MNFCGLFKSSALYACQVGIKAIGGLLLCLFCSGIQAQPSSFWQVSDSVRPGRLATVAGTGGIVFAASMIGLNELWYANEPRTSFHFFNDNSDWLQMDKFGHAFSGYQLSRLSHQALHWSGVGERQSIWYGSGYALLYLMGVEVLDGFSEAWGFSIGDAAANVAGVSLFAAQQLAWSEQRVALKFSYSESGLAHYRPETLGATGVERMLKDYNGQTYWLSANIASFAHKERSLLPWLNVAIGYSGQGMLGGSANPAYNAAGAALPEMHRYRQLLLSIDIDFRRIPTQSGFLHTLFSLINVLKIPAPAIELSLGSLRWHWLYF